MEQVTKRPGNSLHALIAELGMSVAFVAKQTGLSYWTLYDGRIARGRATPQEVDTIADVLRVDRGQVEEALRENARRHEADAGSTGGKS